MLNYFLLSALLIFSACSAPKLEPVKVPATIKQVNFFQDVKPVLDKRCVVCHSCYNSPCQAKFSSFEGIDRGGSKIEVYNATRLRAIDPTRLFIDAKNTQEWRQKGFFSLTQSRDTNLSYNNSLMLHLLHDKKVHPEVVGDYDPEHDKLRCPKDTQELAEYIDEKPNHGMPYGFPALKEKEYNTLASWLAQGAKGLSEKESKKLKTPSVAAQKEIKKWENFFNQKDPKHVMSARYLYEHLYLGHIYFPSAKGEYFELVRSYTPSPQAIDIIATLRPFDDPGVENFYYRLRKIHATIVHKTHMTFKLDDAVLERFQILFIKPKWRETPHIISYDTKLSANPFMAFKQIPVASRYQFLLDNSRYIIMNFIRGPVCRGQMALNVIHDHFWVMFQDPKYDISVKYPKFLDSEVENLALPIQSVDKNIIETFSDKYRKKYEQYYKDKVTLLNEKNEYGVGYESIWRGDKAADAPVLTIYRHFDSASVHKGVLGNLPRTMWVIDYAQFERIYYVLVAGYDVFGNVAHQTNIRRYMDFLRIEGELNFLAYMPKNRRLAMLKSWYINDSEVDDEKYRSLDKLNNHIHYKTRRPKREFIENIVNKHVLKTTDIQFDAINYKTNKNIQLPKEYKTLAEYMQAAKAITLPGSGFISYMTDRGANNIYLRIDMPDGTYVRKTLVINRWHDNVNSMFREESRLNPKKDTMDILDGSIGSYPNVFVVVKFKDLQDFLELMKNCTGSEADIKRLKKYFVSRSDKNFWKTYDWFQNDFDNSQPIESGLYDLNRYARTPWEIN